MTDTDGLIEQLRNPTWTFPEAEDISVLDTKAVRVMAEAADRIAELKAENALLLRRSKASAYLRMDSRD